MNMIYAPFNEDQCRSINEYQALTPFHPFTCPYNHENIRVLFAQEGSLVCPTCGYTQNWVHEFMANWSWKEWGKALASFFDELAAKHRGIKLPKKHEQEKEIQEDTPPEGSPD